MTKDENDRHREGSLPDDPEADVEPMAGNVPLHPLVGAWKPLAAFGDVFGVKPPKRRWLLRRGNDGVLPLGKLGLLAAAGGAGKTMACVQLALAVATGHKWLDSARRGGFDVPPEGIGRVLLALGEEDEEEVHRRMHHAALAMGLTDLDKRAALDRIVVLALSGLHVGLTQTDDGDGVVETAAAAALRAKMTLEAKDNDWRLVVFDPLSRFAGPDAEINNSAATRFIETAESFCKLPGSPTVLVVHHSAQHARGARKLYDDGPKDASLVARGATGITDGARWVASLESLHTDAGDEQLANLAVFSVVKNNYARSMPEPVMLRRNREHNGALHELDALDVQRLRGDESSPPGRAKSDPPPREGAAPPANGEHVPDGIG